MPFVDFWYSNTNTTLPTSWNQAHVFTIPDNSPVLWLNQRERDRWNLARVRGYDAPLLSTPTNRAVARHGSIPRRARPARSRFERNPLNKRALTRR